MLSSHQWFQNFKNKNVKCPSTDKIVGECIAALFTDVAFPSVDGDYRGRFLHQGQSFLNGKKLKSFEAALDQRENHHIHKNSVLPIRPVFGVNKYSTHRVVIYELLNAELIEKFDWLCYTLPFLYFIVKRHKSFSKSFDKIILFERYYWWFKLLYENTHLSFILISLHLTIDYLLYIKIKTCLWTR